MPKDDLIGAPVTQAELDAIWYRHTAGPGWWLIITYCVVALVIGIVWGAG